MPAGNRWKIEYADWTKNQYIKEIVFTKSQQIKEVAQSAVITHFYPFQKRQKRDARLFFEDLKTE